MNEAKKIRIIADHYGYDAKSRQCIEEMAELTQAINKFWRNNLGCGKYGLLDAPVYCEERRNIVEEIADVQIMLYQLGYFLHSEIEVSEMITKKLDRQLERIKRECVEKSTY